MIAPARLVLIVAALCLPSLSFADDGEPTVAAPDVTLLEPEQEEELMRHLEEYAPERFEKAKTLRESDPAAYRSMLAKVATHLEKADPERLAMRQKLREAKLRLGELTEAYGELAKAEQKARRAEVETLCEEIFELRQEQRRLQLEKLNHKLADLSAEIEERDRRKQELIEEFVGELLGEKRKIEGL